MESVPVLYADRAVAVVLKPAGVLSEEGGLPDLLRAQLSGDFYCVHRLDRAVGGVTVLARNKAAAASLSRAIAEGAVRKEYLAVAQGRPEAERARLRDLLYHDARRNKSYVVRRERRGVREALLDYTLLSAAEYERFSLSLLRVELLTGRSHQIRVQFASRGMPLVGDRTYGSAIRAESIALFSHSLRFPHPTGGKELAFTAEMPNGFPWELFG